ncbi:hypothetical protein F0000_27170, partial [Aquimarina sp. RZ0]
MTPGTYSVLVSDSNNCSSGAIPFTIADELLITASLIKDLDCSASPDAEINVTVSGGNGGNTFELNTNGGGYVAYGGGFPFTTTVAGTYQFRVTDSAGCEAETSIITVTPAPDPLATAVANDATCNGLADGSVVITVDTTVGTGPYMIDFNGLGASNQTSYSGLVAGSYTYDVIDAKECRATFSINVGEPDAVTIGGDNNRNITCDASVSPSVTTLGAIILTGITGGTGDYTISLLNLDNTLATTSSPNPVGPVSTTTVTFDDLNFGDYLVEIVDGNSCRYTFEYRIETQPIFTVSETSPVGTCLGGVTVDISITGGTGPFELREFPSGILIPLSAPPRNHQFTNLPFDTAFSYEVIDLGSGCNDIRTIAPQASPSSMVIDITEVPVSCSGDVDGSFSYSITGYAGNELTYEVYSVTDLNTNIAGSLTFNNGNPQGGLTGVAATGIVTSGVVNLSPGVYQLRVFETDISIGAPCNTALEFTIEEPEVLGISLVSQQDGICTRSPEVQVVATGGTIPYTYIANDGAVDVASNSDGLFTTLPAGTYDIRVEDANSCPAASVSVTLVTIADPVFTSVPVFVDDVCVFDNNYTFTVTATGVGQLEYGIDDG